MASRVCIIVLAFSIGLGCAYHRKPMPVAEMKHVVSPYQQFFAKNFEWSAVRRIVLMPVSSHTVFPNTSNTAFPNVNSEIQANLAAELQRAGNFEVVVATIDDPGVRAQDVFASGQFNEIEALRVSRQYQADAILLVNVNQYHPYNPPRLGLSLLLICPAEGVAIASLNGLWDAREAETLQLAQVYLKQNQAWPRSLMGPDRVVEMPDVYQRFVCHQIATSFYPSAATIVHGKGNNPICPVDGTAPVESAMPPATELPPMPPSSPDGF